MLVIMVCTVGKLFWLTLFAAQSLGLVRGQSYDQNDLNRINRTDSYNIFGNGTTRPEPRSIQELSAAASYPNANFGPRGYDSSYAFGGGYYSNSTHRIRGNVTEYVDPTFVRSSQYDRTRTRYGNRDRGRYRDRDGYYEEEEYGINRNVFHPGTLGDDSPAERGKEFKSYEERVRENTPSPGSTSFQDGRRNDGRDGPFSNTYDQAQFPRTSTGGGNSFFDRDGVSRQAGDYGPGGNDGRNYPQETRPTERNYEGQSQNNRNYPPVGSDTRSGNYQMPNQPPINYGIAAPGSSQGFPGSPFNPSPGIYNSRGAFDPGNPNRNVWNQQWSTTTDRPTAPGVLGRWRPDLQGKQRPEEINTVPTPVYVTTNYGRLQGFKVKLYDGPDVPLPARPGIVNVDKVQQTISSFVGIPYARPPIREGRFRPPRTHPGWQLLQAVEFGPACPQPARFFGYTAGVVQVDEDCLYLNVFSPDVGSGAKGSPYPVLFYIHDGDFSHGASNQFPPHQLVGWYDLVVVTVNFRLGALGFLSTADEFSPGNYGMLDLSLALKWVHENIRAFNGDPERITLVGLGSGAAAAGLLMVNEQLPIVQIPKQGDVMIIKGVDFLKKLFQIFQLSPRTRNYVKNIVAMEGAPTADWAAITDKYRLQNTTVLFSQKLGCWHQYEQTSWKMVDCLRSRSWQELANLELDPDVGTFPWSPAVDKEFRIPPVDFINDWKEDDWKFLPDDPVNLLKHGQYSYVKYMTGFSRQSAADLLYANKTLAPNYIVTRKWFDEMINLWVKKYNYTLNPEGVFSAIRHAYTYHPDPLNVTHLREEYIQFLSDALYRAPIDQTVKLLLPRGIQVHQYLLNYTLEGLRLPFWREVPRGLEYYLLSGAPFMDPEFYPERLRVDRSAWTEGDRNMSNFFMTAVANLAHFGQPTRHEVLGIYWERSTPGDLKYLSLNATNNSTMQRNYRQRELTFWTEYMPAVIGRYVPTYPPTTEYWWEPNEPLQIAFWTVSGVCLILIVILVACCLLWRTAKKQRDRIYDDLGLSNAPPIGTIVGDELSEYAETVKTIDSIDSMTKMPMPSLHPNPIPHHSTTLSLPYHMRDEPQRPPSVGPSSVSVGQGSIGRSSTNHLRGERFPTPRKQRREHESPQTQV